MSVAVAEDPTARVIFPETSPYALATSLMENLSMSGLHVGSGDMVALPCEFCEAMIPADQLVVHETGCRPDLACFKKPATGKTGEPHGTDEPHGMDRPSCLLLPCEFCDAMIPADQLVLHASGCQPDLAYFEEPFTGEIESHPH